MEFLDLYDIDRLPTGQKIQRGKPIENDLYFNIIHILILNGDKLLVQQRANRKDAVYPNLWDVSVAGHVKSGENVRNTAQRELHEELGLDYDFNNKRPAFTLNFDHGFDDFYLINMNLDINEIKMQTEEVQATKWATCDDICKMIDEKLFSPYRKEFIKLCFSIKDSVDNSKIGASWVSDD